MAPFDYAGFREDKDAFFKHDPHSPLTPEQQRNFSGLRYFAVNPALDLIIQPEVHTAPDTITMQTSTGSQQHYLRWGQVRFEVDGQPAELTIFASEHGLFLPFVDATRNSETYGAGRYLEPEELPDGTLHIDFNMAYNPYCAYSPFYSCPLTPFENRLDVPIRAGEKLPDGDWVRKF